MNPAGRPLAKVSRGDASRGQSASLRRGRSLSEVDRARNVGRLIDHRARACRSVKSTDEINVDKNYANVSTSCYSERYYYALLPAIRLFLELTHASYVVQRFRGNVRPRAASYH